jgi:hypothetical protein
MTNPAQIQTTEARLARLEARLYAAETAASFEQITNAERDRELDTLRAENAEKDREIAALRKLLTSSPPRDWLTVKEAHEKSLYSEVTIRYWCKTYHIGSFDGRMWRVDRAHLIAFLVDRFGEEHLPAALKG